MSRSSSFNVLFGDGLIDQLLAFPQAYCIGIGFGLLADPTNGS